MVLERLSERITVHKNDFLSGENLRAARGERTEEETLLPLVSVKLRDKQTVLKLASRQVGMSAEITDTSVKENPTH